jgi:exodeoxyribonuclease V alpha subunit
MGLSPVYGEQVQVGRLFGCCPIHTGGNRKIPASGLIPGIGPKTAKRIVETLGKDSLDIIQYNPMKLTTVKGIGKKKAKKIAQAFEEQRALGML